jgi:hypothetical protein
LELAYNDGLVALKVLYKPADEFLAIRIKDLLEQEGVEAITRSYQMPWYDGLAKMMRPQWGEVLVSEEDFDRAREILADLLATIESDAEPDAEESPGSTDDATPGSPTDA